MNILLCNLTRFGDLLQSQPLIHALSQKGHRVHLLCLENFSEAAQLLSPLAGVYPFPASSLRAQIDASWLTALEHLESWLAEVLRATEPQLCINLTATLPARLLSQKLARGEMPVWGFGLDTFGFAANSTLWTTLLQASSLQRGCSPFNIVDLFRATADCQHGCSHNKLQPPAGKHKKMQDMLDAARPQGCTGYIAFQLGASEQCRQWPVAFFAALGDLLWAHKKLCPVLLGSPAEQAYGTEYVCLSHAPCINLVGQTSIPELADVLLQTDVLVSNDTGTMHLAAGLGRPVLALFLATAQAWDTGPCSEDACCLEPDMDCHPCAFGTQCPHQGKCRFHISPDFVWMLLEQRLHTGTWKNAHVHAPNVRVWRSVHDQYGFMDLEALSLHEKQSRTAWIRLQRHFYRQLLEPESPPETEKLHLYAAMLPKNEREKLAHALNTAGDLLDMFQQQGAMLCQPAPAALLQERFLRTSTRIAAHFASYSQFAALGHLWSVAVQEQGDELSAVQHCTHLFQQTLHAWAKVLM